MSVAYKTLAARFVSTLQNRKVVVALGDDLRVSGTVVSVHTDHLTIQACDSEEIVVPFSAIRYIKYGVTRPAA